MDFLTHLKSLAITPRRWQLECTTFLTELLATEDYAYMQAPTGDRRLKMEKTDADPVLEKINRLVSAIMRFELGIVGGKDDDEVTKRGKAKIAEISKRGWYKKVMRDTATRQVLQQIDRKNVT